MAHMERLLLFLLLPVSTCLANVPRLTIRALKGSCVVIPCIFSNPEPRKPRAALRISWFRQRGVNPLTIYADQGPDQVTPAYSGRTAFVGDLAKDNCSLQINNVHPEDAAKLYPWIEPLTIHYELYILQVSDQPEEPSLSDPGEMTEGAPVRIRCSAGHTCPPHPPTLTWNWHRGNASIHHDDVGGGSWNVTSEIYYTPVSGDHNTSLQCTAVYSDSVTSKQSITLQIRYPPKNTRAVVKGGDELREGDNVTLVCSAAGNPAVSGYHWSEGQPEKPLPGNGQEITLENISWDSGPYYCTATNEVGNGTSAPLRPNVMYAPKGTHVVGPEHSLQNGGPMTLECRIERSNPTDLHYSWYKDGNLLGNQTEKTLKIENVTPTNSGHYLCEARNKAGVSSSKNITVRVMDAPKGTHIVGPEKSLQNGDPMTLECRIERSNPTDLRYSWYKDGNLLGNQTENTLYIENATPTDSGHYYCEAHNKAGESSSKNITVFVMDSQVLSTNKSFAVLGGTTAFLLLLLLALFLLLWSSRKKKKEAAAPRQPAPKVPEEVVYVAIDHSKRRGTQRRSMPSEDYVTYAAVKSHSENEAGPASDVTYAKVKKPNRSPKSKEDEIVYATDLKFQHQTPNGQESHNDDHVEYAEVKR